MIQTPLRMRGLALSTAAPAEAWTAMDRHRATAVQTLREHVSRYGIGARCGLPWRCDHAQLAGSALGAG
jgi:hypothetical protein